MKILVTTDFSTNSKAAIRFAKTLSKQFTAVDVVFYHAVVFMKPTKWSNVFFTNYKKDETSRLVSQLRKFVLAALGKEKAKFASSKFVIDADFTTEKDILNYAEKNKVDYICIATQGAGLLRKMLGTHTAYIVNNSKIPVLVIPSHYRSKPLKKATYLSDFDNVKNEISRISAFSNAVKLRLELLHYSAIVADQSKLERNTALLRSDEYKNIKLNIVENDVTLSLVDNISQYITEFNPEMLIMFTNRKRGFFESIFLPSSSVELTYTTKVPILIFPK